MSDEPHHDSAAFLEAVELDLRDKNAALREYRRHGASGIGAGGNSAKMPVGGPGWYVRRTCACHHHAIVSIAFATRAEAERCMRALDDDCRRTLSMSAFA